MLIWYFSKYVVSYRLCRYSAGVRPNRRLKSACSATCVFQPRSTMAQFVFDHLVRGFDRWPGDTINERVEAYVLDLGFAPEDIAAFRDLMLEP